MKNVIWTKEQLNKISLFSIINDLFFLGNLYDISMNSILMDINGINMKIYTAPKTRSATVIWTLEELNLPYESIRVELGNNAKIKSPHPFGKVPFLTEGEFSLSETLAICIYIAEKKQSSFYPKNIQDRAKVHSFISFAVTDLESPIANLLEQVLFTPKEQQSLELINKFTGQINKSVQQIQLNDENLWLMGEDFTLADIFVATRLQFAQLLGIKLNDKLNDYANRASSRPAYLKANEINDL